MLDNIVNKIKKVEAFVSSEKSEAVISALESSSYQATFYESRGTGKGEKQELSFREDCHARLLMRI